MSCSKHWEHLPGRIIDIRLGDKKVDPKVGSSFFHINFVACICVTLANTTFKTHFFVKESQEFECSEHNCRKCIDINQPHTFYRIFFTVHLRLDVNQKISCTNKSFVSNITQFSIFCMESFSYVRLLVILVNPLQIRLVDSRPLNSTSCLRFCSCSLPCSPDIACPTPRGVCLATPTSISGGWLVRDSLISGSETINIRDASI